MTTQERKDTLHEAMDQLNQAMDNIQYALRGTSHERHADAYILGHLRNWIDSDNSFNMGIVQYIESLDKEEGDDE
jgi:hypothetical protein